MQTPHPPGAWKFEFLAAILLTIERLTILAGLVLLLLSSYALWGSPGSPLAPLWKEAVLAFLLVLPLRWGHGRALRKLLRMGREHIRAQRRPAVPSNNGTPH